MKILDASLVRADGNRDIRGAAGYGYIETVIGEENIGAGSEQVAGSVGNDLQGNTRTPVGGSVLRQEAADSNRPIQASGQPDIGNPVIAGTDGASAGGRANVAGIEIGDPDDPDVARLNGDRDRATIVDEVGGGLRGPVIDTLSRGGVDRSRWTAQLAAGQNVGSDGGLRKLSGSSGPHKVHKAIGSVHRSEAGNLRVRGGSDVGGKHSHQSEKQKFDSGHFILTFLFTYVRLSTYLCISNTRAASIGLHGNHSEFRACAKPAWC